MVIRNRLRNRLRFRRRRSVMATATGAAALVLNLGSTPGQTSSSMNWKAVGRPRRASVRLGCLVGELFQPGVRARTGLGRGDPRAGAAPSSDEVGGFRFAVGAGDGVSC
jgi:hypothetical protein